MANLNTYIQLKTSADVAAVRKSNTALLQATVEQSQQIADLRRNMEAAQRQANQLAAQQLEVQLREERAKQEQKLLRKFVFNFETLLAAVDQLATPVEKYAALQYDLSQAIDLAETAVEKLDALEDKRAARDALKGFKERQVVVQAHRGDYEKSTIARLRAAAASIISLPDQTPPVKSPLQPHEKAFPGPQPWVIALTVMAYLMGAASLWMLLSIAQWGVGAEQAAPVWLAVLFLVVALSGFVTLPSWRKHWAAKKQHLAEIQAAHDAAHQTKVAEYAKAISEAEAQMAQYQALEMRAKSEFPSYFDFLAFVQNQFAPEKFSAA